MKRLLINTFARQNGAVVTLCMSGILLAICYSCSQKVENEGIEIPFEDVRFYIDIYPDFYPSGSNILKLEEKLWPRYPGQVFIVNSIEELEKYIHSYVNYFPDIDFSEQTLLLACSVYANNLYQIAGQKTIGLHQFSFDNYKLDVEIDYVTPSAFLGEVTSWVHALITGKLNEDSKIELNVTMKKVQLD